MFYRRITTEGLAHHSYFVSEGGEAVVIDPRRDVDVYLQLARDQGVNIRHVLETHRQEDFVIGSTELAARTGATVRHGGALPFRYGEAIEDGEEFAVGRLRLRAIATPGHTRESMSYALRDTASGDDPVIAFTGDALFVGEVGRTDLYGGHRREELAGWLYDSIFQRLLPLGDWVILAPAHGGGSVCGGEILDRDESTLGHERRHNPRLAVEDREAFVQRKADERMVVPPYFRLMERYNLEGPPLLGPWRLPEALPPEAFDRRARDGAVIVDLRMPQAFAGGHIPGATNIWLAGLSLYAGWVLPLDRQVLLVGDPSSDMAIAQRMLARVGFDQLAGFLRGGFESWQNSGRPIARQRTVSVQEALAEQRRGALILDVRNPDEWRSGMIPDSLPIDLAELEGRLDALPRDRRIIATCSVGHRGAIGASILQRHGLVDVANMLGGTTAWKQVGQPLAPGLDAVTISRVTATTDQPAAREDG